MKGATWLIGVAAVWALMLTGCGRGASGSGESSGQDSAAIEDIQALLRSAEEAENALITLVKNDTNRWTQHEFGWWYRYPHRSDAHEERRGLALAKDTCCLIHEQVYTIGGRLLLDAIRECCTSTERASENEPFSYRLMVGELMPDDTIMMLVPWPMAYGRQGTEHIPPLTNVRVQLCLHPHCNGYGYLIEDIAPPTDDTENNPL